MPTQISLLVHLPTTSWSSRVRGRPPSQHRRAAHDAGLISDAHLRGPANVARIGSPADLDGIDDAGRREVIGVVHCSWHLVPPSEGARAKHDLVSTAGSVKARGQCYGYLQYEFIEVFFLPEPYVFDHAEFGAGTSCSVLAATCRMKLKDKTLYPCGEAVQSLLSNEEMRAALCLPPSVVRAALSGDCLTVLSCCFSTSPRYSRIVPGFPATAVIRCWWRKQREENESTAFCGGPPLSVATARKMTSLEEEEIFFQMPRGCKRRSIDDLRPPAKRTRWFDSFDPMKLLTACRYGSFLRSEHLFKESLDAAQSYNADVDEDVVVRDATLDPSRSTLMRARHKIDIVAILLERRELEAWRSLDMVRNINMYSDGSPVTGAELQGTLADFCMRDQRVLRRTLPGSQLSYGFMGVTAKSIACLWGLLIIGGFEHGMAEWLVSKISSFTTDFGNEIRLLEIPDVLDAVRAWARGSPMADVMFLVKQDKRLYQNAIRIAGWSHTLGGVMKTICENYPNFPRLLSRMRSLCAFWRNVSYRRHVQKKLKLNGIEFNASLLDNFTASFAKWRFETLADVTWQLYKIFGVFQHLRKEWFHAVQDRENFQAVLDACNDNELSGFIRHFGQEVLQPLELFRRWGMVCPCCRHLRHAEEARIKKTACPNGNKSRRLREAALFVQESTDKLLNDARTLTEADVGDANFCNNIRHGLEEAVMLLRLRFKYLSLIPWRCGRMDLPEDAKACLDQIDSVPLDNLDTVSYKVATTHRLELEYVASGGLGPRSSDFQELVDVIASAPLDESAGEGYHRSSHHAQQRAASSITITIVQEVRYKEDLVRLREVIQKYKAKGRDLIRYEWKNWKRVAQVNSHKLGRNIKWRPRQVFNWVYRMDMKASENWDVVLVQQAGGGDPPAPPDDRPDGAAPPDPLQMEYLCKLFDRHQYYSLENDASLPITNVTNGAAAASSGSNSGNAVNAVAVRINAAGAAGVAADAGPDATGGRGAKYFHIIGTHVGRSRPKVMPTILSDRDVAMVSQLALYVQFFDVIREGTTPMIIPTSDPSWVTASDLGPAERLIHNLFKWNEVRRVEEQNQCLQLADKREARPQAMSLNDEHCPSLLLLWHLQQGGWTYCRQKVVHTLDNIGVKVLDGRDPIRRKSYLQVLVRLQHILQDDKLATSIPSDEPQLFYRLLLKGHKVEPKLGNEHYKALLDQQDLLAPNEGMPALDEVPLPEPLPYDEDFVVAAIPQPKTKPKAAAKAMVILPLALAESVPPPPAEEEHAAVAPREEPSIPAPGPVPPMDHDDVVAHVEAVADPVAARNQMR